MGRRAVLQVLAVSLPVAGGVAVAGCSGSTPADNADAESGADASIPRDGSASCETTAGDALGPFWEADAPYRSVLAEANEPGDRTFVRGVIYGGPDCQTPLAGAVVDVWHADASGNYHTASESYRLRGQMLTNDAGAYEFESIRPGQYSGRPRHYHFNVSAPGHAPLTTQLYFAGDPLLGPNDSCQQPTCNSHDPDRIVDFTVEPVGGGSRYTGVFDVKLPKA